MIAVALTPWAGYRRTNAGQQAATRALNRWLKAEARVDIVVDTSSLGDAQGRLLPAYDSRDGLHLNKAGQTKLGQLIRQQAFR